jgi:hypothetical protein
MRCVASRTVEERVPPPPSLTLTSNELPYSLIHLFRERLRVLAVSLALCAAILVAASEAAAQPICPTPTTDVRIELNVPAPGIDNTLPQPALQSLAGMQHHGGRTLGLYRTELKMSSTAHLAQHQVGHEVCVAVDRVTVRISMPLRTIYIVRAQQPGSCGYESVLAHERKHEAADDALLAEEVLHLRVEIADALAALPPRHSVPMHKAADASAELSELIASIVRRNISALFAARAARQAQVDNPQEYRRVRAACG